MNNLIQSKLEEFKKRFATVQTSEKSIKQFLSQSLEEAYIRGRTDVMSDVANSDKLFDYKPNERTSYKAIKWDDLFTIIKGNK